MKLFSKDNYGTSFFKLGSDRNVCVSHLIKSRDVFCFSNIILIEAFYIEAVLSNGILRMTIKDCFWTNFDQDNALTLGFGALAHVTFLAEKNREKNLIKKSFFLNGTKGKCH
jgi:hypothetical protein